MKSTDQKLAETLWQFSQTYINNYQQENGEFPLAMIDDDADSPCQLIEQGQKNTTWQPVKITDNINFDNIASALEITIHADIQTYFCSIYSDCIPAKSDDGRLSLLFAWSLHDFERLQENIIGHIMMKQRLKQKVTIFFAVTDEEDLILSIDIATGAIWVERIGCQPHKKLANSMLEFMQTLQIDTSVKEPSAHL